GGKQHLLGAHPPNAPAPEKSRKTGRWNSPPEIDAAFRRLLDGGSPATADADGGGRVVDVLDAFITWTKENRAGLTASRDEEFCQDFVKARPAAGGKKFGELPVTRLTAKHVTDWLGQHESWGPTTKRNAITALQRGMNWAYKNLGLAKNPIKGMEKPEA